jgi:hypothetical protein
MEELARLVVLLLGAALVINLIGGGTGQVKQWFAAKFLGRA